MKEKIVEQLNQLAEIRDLVKGFESDLVDVVEQALRCCPDKKARYEELKEHLDTAHGMETTVTGSIKQSILEIKESVRGPLLHAVYAAGRASWDTKALEGYAVAHPKILQFKKVGEPSVSIREVKEAKKE